MIIIRDWLLKKKWMTWNDRVIMSVLDMESDKEGNVVMKDDAIGSKVDMSRYQVNSFLKKFENSGLIKRMRLDKGIRVITIMEKERE
jgi:CTP-dependent riboflavin kinase